MSRKRSKNGTTEAPKKVSNPRGQMRAFTPQQIKTLQLFLRDSKKLHARRDYALMCVAVDTGLRSVDLLSLTFGDVLLNGEIVDEMQTKQAKTGELVISVLTAPTRAALADYIGKFSSSIREDPSRKLFDMTSEWFRKLIKEWVSDLLHLDPKRYSGHSFRRTKAKQIYAQTKNLAYCKKFLGHTSIQHTQEYLGVEQSDALEVAKSISLLED